MLFRNKEPKKNLPQEEREAVVDLLHLCLYADAHVSLKEGQFITQVVDVIGWDPNLSFSAYESRSIAVARAARADDPSKKDFIEFAASRLKTPGSRPLAVSLCEELSAADGTAAPEGALVAQIRTVLGVS